MKKIIVVLIILIVYMTTPYNLFTVTGHSMDPTFKNPGLAITKKVHDIEDLKHGDIIAYTDTIDGVKMQIIHRILQINPDGSIITKGDGNRYQDKNTIYFVDVIGKMVYYKSL